MTENDASKDLPADGHLRKDVAPESAGEDQGLPEKAFLPGQTNAGQQVSGLMSGSGYAADQDPEKQPDGNNPI